MATNSAAAPVVDFKALRRDLCRALRSNPGRDGTMLPVLVRLAWHCCGTYDATTKTGGSNGCTMRFPAEQADPENAGLSEARAFLDGVRANGHEAISCADLCVT